MEKLRWGLIGCGDIARKRVAPALRDLPNCELIAVSRARADLAQSFAAEFGARRWPADWRELIVDKEIDAVYIATPVHLHAAQTIAAAEAGKHVLCEKPLAMNVAECDRMIEACRAYGVTLGVAYYRHFYPVVARIKEIVSAGEIGDPVLAQINAFEYFDPDPNHPRGWLIEREQSGGGPMFDFGCHRIEVLVNLFGPINQTTGMNGNAVFTRGVEDTGVAIFRFDSRASGVLSVTHAAWEPQDTLDIYGSRGSLHVPVLNVGTLHVKTYSAGERTEEHPPDPNFHSPLIDDFVRAVWGRREPMVGGTVGREVARVEELVYAGGNFPR
ncbi:MAG: Gfo/Idh/MocA family oxidoreductase [Acidobacteriota bacterium]|nr:Gfo/Idh/MocA family oxidoreductase [Acidobacteriota bacterium]